MPKFAWVLLFLVGTALLEISAGAWVRSSVPKRADYAKVAAFLSSKWEAKDGLAFAPDWIAPLAITYIKEATVTNTHPDDFSSFERVWEVSIRGATTEDLKGHASSEKHFGELTLRRFDLGKSPVLYDFRENVEKALVSFESSPGKREPCKWRSSGVAMGGGIHGGPIIPARRFVCTSESWKWVGQTMMTDLSMRPREVVWNHPFGKLPVTTRYKDVPLGDRIVLYGGLQYQQARRHEGGVVTVVVRVDERVVSRVNFAPREDWKRVEIATQDLGAKQKRGTVSFETFAEDSQFRVFGWSATVRQGPRRPLPVSSELNQ